MCRIQRLQFLCPWANSRDKEGFQFLSKNFKYVVCWTWLYVLECSRTRGQQLFWQVMFLERAVGEFPAHGKSKHFAFPAHYCCSWAKRFCFFWCILLIIEREVFQRIQKVERIFLYSFSFWEKDVSPRMACVDWRPFIVYLPLGKTTWALKRKTDIKGKKNSLKFYLFLLYVNSEKNKILKSFFLSIQCWI